MKPPPTWEEALGPMVRAADPGAARARLLETGELPPDVAEAVAALDPTGLRVLGLLVARLRFDRLMLRSPAQRARYAADPEGWSGAFRSWHAENPADPEREPGP